MRALQNALTLTAVLVVAVSRPAWSQSRVARIAFIDVQRVLVRSAAGVAARDQLEREKAGMQQKMDAKRKELEMLRDELEKKGPLMTAEARRDKQDAFERNRRDAARLADDLQKELEKKEQQLLQRVLQDLSGVIEKIGKERGLVLIVEKRGAAVLYGAPAPVLRVPAPQQALIELLTLFHPPAEAVAGVAPSAVVARDASVAPTATVGALAVIESGAVIGPHVRIGPLAFVGAGAEVGEASVVHARVAVCARVRLGKRGGGHPGAVIGADGFRYGLDGGAHPEIPQGGSLVVADH